MSPSITHGDLAPDKMSSTKLKRVSVTERKTVGNSCLDSKITQDFHVVFHRLHFAEMQLLSSGL